MGETGREELWMAQADGFLGLVLKRLARAALLDLTAMSFLRN